MRMLIAAAAAMLVGCAGTAPTPEQAQQARDAHYKLVGDLSRAPYNAVVTCTSQEQCDKAFKLAKIYVQQTSDMKVQFSDNVSVFTYNPTKWGLIGMRATRVPGAGSTETIALEVTCKGMDRSFMAECASRVIPRYNGFVPFITGQD